jgi:hypothetical protein
MRVGNPDPGHLAVRRSRGWDATGGGEWERLGERAQVDVEALLRRAQTRTMTSVIATPLPDAHRTCAPPSLPSLLLRAL